MMSVLRTLANVNKRRRVALLLLIETGLDSLRELLHLIDQTDIVYLEHLRSFIQAFK